MSLEELLTYGFKRVIEELQKNREVLEQIEMNTRTATGELIRINGWLKQIDNAASLTQMGVLETKQLVKGMSNGGKERS